MKQYLLPPLLGMVGLLVGCEQETSTALEPSKQPEASEPAAQAGATDPAVRAALEAQAIGSKLLGNTVRLSGGSFKPMDLQIAPEAYFVYYSASW